MPNVVFSVRKQESEQHMRLIDAEDKDVEKGRNLEVRLSANQCREIWKVTEAMGDVLPMHYRDFLVNQAGFLGPRVYTRENTQRSVLTAEYVMEHLPPEQMRKLLINFVAGKVDIG